MAEPTSTSEQQPSDDKAAILHAQAQQAYKAGDMKTALDLARRALKFAPDLSACSLLVSSILLRLDRVGDCIQVLKQALKTDSENQAIWNNLGSAYRRVENWGAARACFERAIKIKPDYRLAWDGLLGTQISQKDAAGTLKTADTLMEKFGADPKQVMLKGDSLMSLDRVDEARVCYEQVLFVPPYNSHALERWTKIMLDTGREDAALKRLLEMAEKEPENPAIWGNIGSVHNRVSNGEKAREGFFRAHQLAPDSVRYRHDVGIVERYMGNIQEAHKWFGSCLEIDPFHASALRVYGSEHKYEYGDEAFNRLNRAAARLPKVTPESRVQLHYALGKAYDDVGDLATAFEHYIAGGRAHLNLNPFNDEERDRLSRLFKKVLDREYLTNPPEQGTSDPTAIFILGMPRSGTSLTEQVLASHSQVHGAGELKLFSKVVNSVLLKNKYRIQFPEEPYWPQDYTASFKERGDKYIEELRKISGSSAQRVVDKMPGNHAWVGLIHLFMPKASIIHTRRHPVEICLSCFRIFFPDGQLWSYDLRTLGKAYRHYHETMEFWRSVLPEGRMLELRYEDMVNDFENQAKRIISYCGLEWEDACLDFHNTERSVRTASAAQVRKPIYKTSTNRWRKYEQYLGPLLEEIGDLVEAYEAELAQSSPGNQG